MHKSILLMLVLLVPGTVPASGAAYDYPFVNAYEATVLGTPSIYMPPLPEEIPREDDMITIFPERRIPDLFWYSEGLRFSLVAQEKPAPLIFVVAGTGGDYRSGKVKLLQKAFYQAGFHVLSLSSPTHPNFIIHASATSIPGHVVEDSRDIYRVMQLAYGKVQERIVVTQFHITGYSLGAVHAAFVAQMDAREKVFGIQKVLMVNPPVNLYNSVDILDRMLTDNPASDSPEEARRFVDYFMTLFAETYERTQALTFEGDFLYEMYKTRPPEEEKLGVLIGVSFRFASRDLIFTADVMTKAGYVVPADRELSSVDSLTPYFKVLGQTGFTDYYSELFLPFFQDRYPGLTDPALREQMSLRGIEGFLRRNHNVGLLHNADDLIMAPGEIDYLKEVFGDRARIYPTGGHCGNMAHHEVLASIVGFFTDRGGRWEEIQ